MPDFEKKIEKNMEKAEKIRSRIDELKRQLKHIESETADLMMASIRESTNMTVNDYEQIIRDLNMMQEMRNNGFTDEEILAMTIRKQAKKRRNRRTPMKHRIFSTTMAAMLLAVSSVGMSASAEEVTETTTAIEETTEQEETTTEPKAEEPTETQPYSFSGEDFMAIMNALAGSGKGTMTFTPEESNLPDFYGDDYYDTDGNATLVKSEQIIYNSEEMQFIAVTTKDGHVFYVLINYSAENGEDNVYFLNNVKHRNGHSD